MKRLVMLSMVAVLTVGCASTPKQSFNAAANTHVKKVAVINPPAVERVNINILAHPGSSFGLIGGLVAAADMESKTGSYNQALGANKPDWGAYTQQQMTSALQSAGYSVESLAVRQKGDTEHLSKYPSTTADAFLDYYFGVAHLAAGPTTNYVPSVNLNVRLVDAKKQTVLYEESLSSGLTTNTATTAASAPKEYKNMAELNANAAESAETLKQGITQITQRIGKDLKK